MNTILFHLNKKGFAVLATVLDENREPVDGFTGIEVRTALDYASKHPVKFETVDIHEGDPRHRGFAA